MAHWAKIDDSGVVLDVLVTSDNDSEASHWLKSMLGGTWIKTSYNTIGGKHLLGGTPFRKNYASVGGLYDPVTDAFIPPKPDGDGWVLNSDTFLWENPEANIYVVWDEELASWSYCEENTQP